MALCAWGLNLLTINFFLNLLLSIAIYFGLLYLLKEPLLIAGKNIIRNQLSIKS